LPLKGFNPSTFDNEKSSARVHPPFFESLSWSPFEKSFTPSQAQKDRVQLSSTFSDFFALKGLTDAFFDKLSA